MTGLRERLEKLGGRRKKNTGAVVILCDADTYPTDELWNLAMEAARARYPQAEAFYWIPDDHRGGPPADVFFRDGKMTLNWEVESE